METEPIHSADIIWPRLKRRFFAPLKSVTFYAQLFFAVILCGGAGIWLALCRSGTIKDVAAALLTYFPALVAAALIDFTHDEQRYIRSFGVIGMGVFLVIFLGAAACESFWQCVLGVLGSLLGVLFWWVAIGEKDWLRDVTPENALGGSEGTKLLKSSEEGWQ